MNAKEAINNLKNIIEHWTYKPTEVKTAICAIKALKIQMPKKPREHYNWGDFTKEQKLENAHWFCGKCDKSIEEIYNFCPECGQKIDWS